MSRSAELTALSLGNALDAGPAACGSVHSVFRHAVNLMIRGDMWTLLTEQKSDLPFGIRVALPHFGALGFHRGESVHVRSGFVGIASRLVIDCRAAVRWLPARMPVPAPGLSQRLAVVAEWMHGRSWSGSGEMARAVRSAMRQPAALGEVLAKIIGRGPGATPSGDDVLVGVFAALTSAHSATAVAPDAELLRRALLPLLPGTTDVSAHLLRQAARGLPGRDVHELIFALIGNTSATHLSGAVRRVIDTGATSGADTCEGLLAFAPACFNQQPELAVA